MGGSVQQSIQTSSKIQESFAGISNLIEPPPQITLAKKHSISHDITKAPKWMKTPNGASFGVNYNYCWILHINKRFLKTVWRQIDNFQQQ